MRQILLYMVLWELLSCEKVISVNIRDEDKRYVIEGVLTNRVGGCSVLISQTKNFNEDNRFVGVSGAQVTIADSNGLQRILTESGTAGIYTVGGFAGTRGMRYTLKVTIGGQLFTASSTMPRRQVFIDTVYLRNNYILDEEVRLVTVQYRDPLGKGNCYRFLQYVNGVQEKAVFIRNDDLTDGKAVAAQLAPESYRKDNSKIKSGDTLKVEMLCIDPVIYKYWYSLDQGATGETGSASPANPVTNLSGGALGYFSAHTYQAKTFVAP